MQSVTIPEGVTSIGEDAFRGCSALTEVNFGADSQLTSIGRRAFEYCSNLTSITIPASVTLIGAYAFDGCTSLDNAYFEDTTTWYLDISSRPQIPGLANPSTAAYYLTDYYDQIYLHNDWEKR